MTNQKNSPRLANKRKYTPVEKSVLSSGILLGSLLEVKLLGGPFLGVLGASLGARIAKGAIDIRRSATVNYSLPEMVDETMRWEEPQNPYRSIE